MDILQKSWKVSTPPLKKLFSRTITHRLSREISKNNFEVVYEGFLDSHNPLSEQPDVVIYSKQDTLVPVMAIEICKTEELLEMILIARHMLEQHALKEFFIYDYESGKWYLVNDKDTPEKATSFSNLFSLDLKETIRMFPYLTA